MQSGSAQVPAPPGMWNLVDGNVMTSKTSSETAPGEAHDASMAWKHCRNVARDEGRSSDLYDLLSHSVREAQYSFPPQGVGCRYSVVQMYACCNGYGVPHSNGKCFIFKFLGLNINENVWCISNQAHGVWNLMKHQ